VIPVKRRVLGTLLIVVALVIMITYTYLLFFTEVAIQLRVLRITVYIMVMILLVVLIATGYMFLRTPSFSTTLPDMSENEEEKCSSKNS